LITKALELQKTLPNSSTSNSTNRSHIILTIYIESQQIIDSQDDVDNSASSNDAKHVSRYEQRMGKLHLVELAGFERTCSQKTCDVDGQYINRSLLALETVLYALSHIDAIRRSSQQQKQQQVASCSSNSNESKLKDSLLNSQMHVPYLNSKLTHMLKDSLARRTTLFINIRPEYSNHMESLYALRYANRLSMAGLSRDRGKNNKQCVGSSSKQTLRRRKLPKANLVSNGNNRSLNNSIISKGDLDVSANMIEVEGDENVMIETLASLSADQHQHRHNIHHPLKSSLINDSRDDSLDRTLKSLMRKKPASHRLCKSNPLLPRDLMDLINPFADDLCDSELAFSSTNIESTILKDSNSFSGEKSENSELFL